MKKSLILFGMDVVAAAVIFLGIWIFNYALPQKGTPARTLSDMVGVSENLESTEGKIAGGSSDATSGDNSIWQQQNAMSVTGASAGLPVTKVKMAVQDWRQKFADKFTEEVVSTPTKYTSPNVSVEITYHQYDSGTLDETDSGKHTKYGTKVSYVLADIYIGDITCFQTAFAQDTYGVGYSEKLSDMSARLKSILAVNGDSYSNNRHQDNGTIVRNGVIYRNEKSGEETCVLNWDGTMDIYQPGMLDEQTLIDKGAYQSWIFGPSLLDSSGKAKTSFWTWDYIRQSHPRTAIGYYEPGHYCLLLVDGRQPTSRGMFLDEMAKVFEDLGCKAAYNLDGGHCSFMTLSNAVVNHPYKPEHEIEDGIFITEGLR